MGKREDLISRLKPILNDRNELERFIIDNSNIPGPRGNLELAFVFSELYDNLDVLLKWIEKTIL